LTTPAKLASRWDWSKINGGSILSLDIQSDRIGLALVSHPSYGESPQALQSMPLARKSKVTEECKSALANIIEQHKVCGFVVSWPLQPDSKRMGAACGRVLHTLEQLLPDSSEDGEQATKDTIRKPSPLISANRPCVLWNDTQPKLMEETDAFGRLAAYSKAPSRDKTIHIASIEQYNIHKDEEDESAAIKAWNDFMRVHWPALYRHQQRREFAASQREKHTLLTQTRAALAAASARSSNDASSASYMEAAAV